MRSITTKETLAVFLLLVGALAVDHYLPLGQLPSLLLTVFVTLVGVVALVPGAWQTLYRKTGIGAGAWLLAALIAGGGIALSYLLGDPQPYYDGLLPYRDYQTVYGWAASIFVACSLGVAVAVGHLSRYRRIRTASVVPAADVDEGVVAIEGRVEPDTTTIQGPVSNDDTVWYRRATERPTLFSGHREIDLETAGERFYVTDGSGQIRVLPERIDQHTAAEFAHAHTSDDGNERQREWSYKPHEPVTVIGTASEVSRANYAESVVIGLEDSVIVARRTIPELRSWATRRTVLGGGIAIVGGGVSFLVMLVTSGVL